MTEPTLQDIIAQGESLTVEFKSDRGPLDDSELLDTVVCMANGPGGLVLVGVENDGSLAGLLLVGKEAALRQYLPAHEVAFQVLHGTDIVPGQ